MIFDILIFIFGLIVGSFLGALSFRLPRGISIAKGRSFCPKCKKMISWYDNIPLFSYMILGGKCRNCKKHISLRYPLIEFFTALGFLLIFFFLNTNLLSLVYYLLTYCLLVLIFVIDLEHQIIPDGLVFSGIGISIIFFLFSNTYFYPNVFAGFLAASLLMLVHLATRGRGMGLGDIKFAVWGGMIVGFDLFLIWLFMSFLTGGIVGVFLIFSKKAGLKDKIAFGPFLVLGLVITLIYGNSFLKFLGF